CFISTFSSWTMITDMLGSIHTSCDVPAGAVFGPCDPSGTSLGDSIAIIALKCSDRRATAYTHQVDTSLAGHSLEAPVWLRLVRSARSAEEQNLEAFVKDSHLFYRALKNISKMSELLVWYGTELVLLVKNNIKTRKLTKLRLDRQNYICCFCRQSFLFEFPFLAHQRFFCSERPARVGNSKSGSESSKVQNKASTDFHSLAKNLESFTKRRHSLDSESGEESDEEKLSLSGEHPRAPPSFKRACATVVKRKPGGCDSRMINEGWRSSPRATQSLGNLEVLDSKPIENSPGPHSVPHTRRRSPLVTAGPAHKEKSAFVRPPRSISQTANQATSFRFSPGITPTTFPSIPTLPNPAAQATKQPQDPALVSRGLLRQQSLLCQESGLWSRMSWSPLLPRPPVPAVPAPPGLCPSVLTLQNWCAKCSISFHMTSDLVQHMRSHHKRSSERPHQQQQDAKPRLRCPVCQEGFRERHHLSRHMTSHL
uniref:Si:dkeyp-41f9.4 n=1 Tax=Astyanax mexicanus TaxID=7994 RepID=A0A8B9JRS7_ASTMX